MTVSTADLIKNIQLATDLNAFSRENKAEFLFEAPHEYLNKKLLEKELELAAVYNLSGLDHSYCYRIFSGERAPGRNAVIRIIFAMGLSIEEAQHALRLYGQARLDPRCYRDATILFALSKGYTLQQTVELLYEFGEAEL